MYRKTSLFLQCLQSSWRTGADQSSQTQLHCWNAAASSLFPAGNVEVQGLAHPLLCKPRPALIWGIWALWGHQELPCRLSALLQDGFEPMLRKS